MDSEGLLWYIFLVDCRVGFFLAELYFSRQKAQDDCQEVVPSRAVNFYCTLDRIDENFFNEACLDDNGFWIGSLTMTWAALFLDYPNMGTAFRRVDDLISSGMMHEDIPWNVIYARIYSSVRVILDLAFSYQSRLERVILNKELEEIGEYPFQLCYSLQKIVIPNAVKKIKKLTLSYCSNFLAITLGNGLEEIGECTFFRCTPLGEITIPHTVKRIKDQALFYCSGLRTVTLGDELEEIGEGAFENCSMLYQVIYLVLYC